MKFIPAQLMYLLQDRQARRNIRYLAEFLLFLIFFITAYTYLFHVLMALEGRDYSWVTGLYWTLTVMSTLGFGDITFSTDLGRLFSIIVLLSGIVFLLVMLPFSFIQFFYAPWLEAQSKSRAPRELPEKIHDHVLIIGFGPIAMSLVSKLNQYGYPYAILVAELNEALDIFDRGYKVVVGDLDDPTTYFRIRATQARMAVVLADDMKNTNITFTIREVAPNLPIVVNADMDDSVDILQLAGATQVFQFMTMLGQFLARRALGSRVSSNIIGRFDGLVIVEAPATRSRLEGHSLSDCGLRAITGMNVVGFWERGEFRIPGPHDVIGANTVLVLAGSEEQLQRYDLFIGKPDLTDAPVLILGGGRVGQAAAKALADNGTSYRIVDKNPKVANQNPHTVIGSAADLDTLNEAGIQQAPAVFVTTHNDDINIYLTIYCRRLRPDIQIISRATLDRNFSNLHTAGADLVMSHASLAAHTIFNSLQPGKVVMLTEGLNIFQAKVHPSLAGKNLIQSDIRPDTGCTVIALRTVEETVINPDPSQPLPVDAELILIGTTEAERRFAERFPETQTKKQRTA